MVEAHIHCRVAAADDAAGIFRVLAEVAPEIPLLMDTGELSTGAQSGPPIGAEKGPPNRCGRAAWSGALA
jgi:hypothetical protein